MSTVFMGIKFYSYIETMNTRYIVIIRIWL